MQKRDGGHLWNGEKFIVEIQSTLERWGMWKRYCMGSRAKRGGKMEWKRRGRKEGKRLGKEWNGNTEWRKGMGKEGGGNQEERKKPSCGVAPKSDRG